MRSVLRNCEACEKHAIFPVNGWARSDPVREGRWRLCEGVEGEESAEGMAEQGLSRLIDPAAVFDGRLQRAGDET